MAKKDKRKTQKKGKKGSHSQGTPEITNRKARHNFHITETLECGIALVGSEVKSIRQGKVSIGEGYAKVDEKTNELWLHGIHVGEYDPARGSVNAHSPTRKRKLLAHSREIRKLEEKTRVKGTTLVPLKLYFKNGFAKLLIGVGVGKRKRDQREDNKKRDAQREINRAMSHKIR